MKWIAIVLLCWSVVVMAYESPVEKLDRVERRVDSLPCNPDILETMALVSVLTWFYLEGDGNKLPLPELMGAGEKAVELYMKTMCD